MWMTAAERTLRLTCAAPPKYLRSSVQIAVNEVNPLPFNV